MPHSIRFGVDVGGTFTDFALTVGGALRVLKLPTSADAPERTILTGLARMMADNDIAPAAVDGVVHGTTLAANAIISRAGARTALLTTAGFRDVLAQADEGRFDRYDINLVKPEPLVPRWWRYAVTERLSAAGDVLVALDTMALDAIAAQLADQNIESLAICFLHAHTNPSHERAARTRLQELLPDLAISLSSDVSPQIGEYERFSTTVANAYVQPIVSTYLLALETGLRDLGLRAPVFMFVSNGGLCHLDIARKFPIRLVESGPAGGAIFAAMLADDLGEQQVLAFDMGGTTAKVCFIDQGLPRRADMFEVARQHMHRAGSGLPIRIPVIDLVEIGAGGGSIARVDGLRRLQVGPQSAGALPGPACYNRGGEAATVTDANMVVGKLAPQDFEETGISPLPERARRAVAEDVATRLGLDELSAAAAIAEVVEEQMAGAAREHGREMGIDPRARVMIAFGGAAPLHAVNVAAKLGIERIIIPRAAGIGSAVGFLQAQAVYEITRSVEMSCDAFDERVINDTFAQIESEARQAVEAAAPGRAVQAIRTVFMRYRGQGHAIPIAVAERRFLQGAGDELKRRFRAGYIDIYQRPVDGISVELVALGVRVSAARDDVPVTAAHQKQRPVSDPTMVFDFLKGVSVCVPVKHRQALAAGDNFEGPGLIKDFGTTLFVPNGYCTERLPEGHLLITRTAPHGSP